MTISHSNTPYEILGEMFKLNYKLLQPYYYPTNYTQAGITSAGPSMCAIAGALVCQVSEIPDLTVNWER